MNSASPRHISVDVWVVSLAMAAVIGIGSFMAWRTPLFRAPDERAHVLDIAIVSQGHWPSLHGNVRSMEAHQPQLYYVLLAPVYSATAHWTEPHRVGALRVFSLIIGCLTVLAIWKLAKTIFPNQLWMQILVVAFTAMNPMFIFMNSVVNNDVLAALFGALILWRLVRRFGPTRDSRQSEILDAVILTAAVLTKVVLWPLAGGLALVVIWKSKRHWLALFIVGAPFLLAAASWFIHNQIYYHDPTLQRTLRRMWAVQHRHFFNVTGILRWGRKLYDSFWAVFGQMDIGLRPIYYQVLRVVLAPLAVGWFWYWLKKRQANRLEYIQTTLCLAVASVVTGGIFLYSLSFYQPQGRYLFPVIGAFAVMIAVAIRQLARPQNLRLVVPIVLAGLVILDWASIRAINLMR